MDQQKKINFDPTINLGHIGSMAAVLIVGVLAFSDIKQDQAVANQKQAYLEARIKESEERNNQRMNEMGSDVKDMRKAVENIANIIILKIKQSGK